MRIVVIGGTGHIGSQLVKRLLNLDHMAIPASPNTGVNTLTGEGLKEVMKDTDVVIDVSNSPSFEDDAVMDFFQRSTMNLLHEEEYAGVKHHIILSVVGTDRLPESGYLRAKNMQEELIRLSGIPYSILRSTQFFEFAGRIAEGGTTGEEVHISPAAFQPIASEETVAALADLAVGPPLNTFIEIAGPVVMPMSEFIRYYLDKTEDSRRLIEDPHARYFGTELNDQSLVPGENRRLGKIKYEDWFRAQLVSK
jgi:uncharacterized protein YbjT (DUF2867 family)